MFRNIIRHARPKLMRSLGYTALARTGLSHSSQSRMSSAWKLALGGVCAATAGVVICEEMELDAMRPSVVYDQYASNLPLEVPVPYLTSNRSLADAATDFRIDMHVLKTRQPIH